jgi:hypothetical protein
MNDLKLVSGGFFDLELSKEKQYLYKYFDTEIQMQFLRYYHTFGNCDRFMEHTGFFCTKRWLRDLKNKYEKLVVIYDEAKKNMDFTLLANIQNGNFKV